MRAAATFLVVLGALLALPAAALATDQVRGATGGRECPDRQPDRPRRSRRPGARVHRRRRRGRAARADHGPFARSCAGRRERRTLPVRRRGGLGRGAVGDHQPRRGHRRSDAFPDGPPVFWMEQDGTSRFLRPGSDAGGRVQIGGDGPITVSLSRPSRLEVTATASKRRVTVGRAGHLHRDRGRGARGRAGHGALVLRRQRRQGRRDRGDAQVPAGGTPTTCS